MIRTLILCSIFLIPGYQCEANDLSLSVSADSDSVLVGLPIIIQLRITSDSDFTLDGDFYICDGHTELLITDDSGNPAPRATETPCSVSERSPFDSDHKRQFGGLAEFTHELFMLPGSYLISAKYRSFGPYLDRYSQTDQRPVEGIWIGELVSNTVELSVNFPEGGEDQNAFLNLGPSAEKMDSPEALVWFLKTNAEKILTDYPKSNYAAWIRWKWGLNGYNHYSLGMNNLSIDKEFTYNQYLKKMESGELGSRSSYRPEILGIIEAWEPLHRDFPNFKHRPFVMMGLAQAYIRLGKFEKARPLIKELLQRYSWTESGKKILAYKEHMIKQKLWQ